MELHERIKVIRKYNHLTQAQFGAQIGVKGNTITGYEKNIRTPSKAILLSICRTFAVDENWMFTGEGLPYPLQETKQLIPERIKYLRKNILHLTQEEFAAAIKISRSNLGNIETGRINITDRIISDICERFNVDEVWLRTGTNSPLLPQSKDQELTILLEKLLTNPKSAFQRRLITALLKLPPESWAIIAEEFHIKD